jgi:small subunit ribosomal protein S18
MQQEHTTKSIVSQRYATQKNNPTTTSKKTRKCPLCAIKAPAANYKDPDFLKQFISDGGRMLPSRITNICAKHQRSLKKTIKRSRIIALLPFTFNNK